MGSWAIDAYTLKYASEKYGLDASCNCKDQWGTDGYTLWGGYYNQAYYPSVNNMLCPASGAETQINVPVFRMLGSDPILQYGYGTSIEMGVSARQAVCTLEPVYDSAGGGNPVWTDWYLEQNFSGNGLSFAYTQAGQENSFGWESMKDGLEYQFSRFSELPSEGKLIIETIIETGIRFKSKYQLTPASTVTAENDWLGEGRKSVWYCCKNYRITILAENDTFFIRDMYLFDGSYKERYLDEGCHEKLMVYDNLPFIDSHRCSGGGIRAGLFFCNSDGAFKYSSMKYEEISDDSIRVTFTCTDGGQASVTCTPQKVMLESDTPYHIEDRSFPDNRIYKITDKSKNRLTASYNGHTYILMLTKGSFSTDSILPEDGTVKIALQVSRKTDYTFRSDALTTHIKTPGRRSL